MFLGIHPQNHSPTALPNSPTLRAWPSVLPSFPDRVKPVEQNNRKTNTRARALSAISNLDAAKQDALSVDYEKQLNLKSPYGSTKERQNPIPQPLPLPLPPKAAVLKNLGSSKKLNTSGPSNIAGPQPLPLPLPPPLPLSQPSTLPQSLTSIGLLRHFSYEELATACNNFCPERCMSRGLSSMIYRASFGDESSGFRKLEATVACVTPSSQAI